MSRLCVGFLLSRAQFLVPSPSQAVQPTGPDADKWSSKVSSPPSPFNGVQTIEKLNQLSPVQIHPVSSLLHLAWFISPFSLIPVSAALPCSGSD